MGSTNEDLESEVFAIKIPYVWSCNLPDEKTTMQQAARCSSSTRVAEILLMLQVTRTKDGNRTRCPCSVCLVLSSELNDVGTKHDVRTREFMESIFDEPDPAERERQAALYSVHLGRKVSV